MLGTDVARDLPRDFGDRGVCVYALVDPTTNLIRYIGETHAPQSRYRRHLSCRKGVNRRVHGWITGLKRAGLKPRFFIMSVHDIDESHGYERSWIGLMSMDYGPQIMNEFDRGDFVRLEALKLQAKLLRQYEDRFVTTRKYRRDGARYAKK